MYVYLYSHSILLYLNLYVVDCELHRPSFLDGEPIPGFEGRMHRLPPAWQSKTQALQTPPPPLPPNPPAANRFEKWPPSDLSEHIHIHIHIYIYILRSQSIRSSSRLFFTYSSTSLLIFAFCEPSTALLSGGLSPSFLKPLITLSAVFFRI